MLAPDGRCKTLDMAADGYVRAESCIVLLLEALSHDAATHAIIYGSAVRQVRCCRFWHTPLVLTQLLLTCILCILCIIMYVSHD